MTNRGFTLAEVLVALVLTGTVLVTGATAFSAAVDALDAAEHARLHPPKREKFRAAAPTWPTAS